MRVLLFYIFFTIAGFVSKAEKLSTFSQTAITFKIKNAGVWVDGKFNSVLAEGYFDPNSSVAIMLRGTAYVKSIHTDNSLRDKHLRTKEEFFNMAKTPTITMQSTKVTKISAGRYDVYWNLTMRGITRNFKTEMNAKAIDGGYQLISNFTINRNDWKLGGGGIKTIAMGDLVEVRIETMVK